MKVDCAAWQHVALLTPEALLRLGLSAGAKVLDLKLRLRCRGCGVRAAGGGVDQAAGREDRMRRSV